MALNHSFYIFRKVTIFKTRVLVRLRPSVLDPAGEAASSASKRLGVEGVSNLRIGKLIELDIEAPNKEEALKRIELLSDRLFANPVIEDWKLDLLTGFQTQSTNSSDPS